jgi:hypothetical protein
MQERDHLRVERVGQSGPEQEWQAGMQHGRTPTATDARRAAIRLLQGGRLAEAERALRGLLLADPGDVVALSNLGVALQGLERRAEAEEAYRAALERDPGHAEAAYNLGALLLEGGAAEAAAGPLRQAADVGGAGLRGSARVAQARAAAALRGAGGAPEGDRAAGLMRRGLALWAAGQLPGAIGCFQAVLAAEPGHGLAAFCAGELCVWTGRLAEARHCLTVALRWMREARPELPAPPARPLFDRAAARTALFAALDALEGAGLAVFLNGGTALGCVREGDFISFDSDVDLGVPPGTPPEEVIDAIDGHPGLSYAYHDVWRDAVLRVRFHSVEGIGGDVFLYQEDEDGRWCGVQRGALALRWRDTPFGVAPVEFLGRRVMLPDPAERYLEENYGDWRRPDPDHVPGFSAPNLIGRDGEMPFVVALLAITGALAQRREARAARYCREGAARFPGEAVFAQTLAAIGGAA